MKTAANHSIIRADRAGKNTKKEPQLSRVIAQQSMSRMGWQRALRRQFGREQVFGMENLRDEPLFSEFRVSSTDCPLKLVKAASRPADTRAPRSRPQERQS